jgi:hypothetical protein
MEWGGMNWIGVAQDKDKWTALFGFLKILGCSSMAAQVRRSGPHSDFSSKLPAKSVRKRATWYEAPEGIYN